MHDLIRAGAIVLAVLFQILMNQRGVDKLIKRMERLESMIDKRIGKLEMKIGN